MLRAWADKRGCSSASVSTEHKLLSTDLKWKFCLSNAGKKRWHPAELGVPPGSRQVQPGVITRPPRCCDRDRAARSIPEGINHSPGNIPGNTPETEAHGAHEVLGRKPASKRAIFAAVPVLVTQVPVDAGGPRTRPLPRALSHHKGPHGTCPVQQQHTTSPLIMWFN